MNLRLLLALALSIPVASACIYDTDDPCVDTPNSRVPADPIPPVRNPYSGQCETWGGGGGGGGGGTCGEYEVQGDEAGQRAPMPDWGLCYGYCETLNEDECLVDAQCRASYLSIDTADAPVEPQNPFNECWALSGGEPFQTSGCGTYDADECSRHNECVAIHNYRLEGGAGSFYLCADEPTTANPGSCTGDVACATLPPECPTGTTPGINQGCWSGFCIPLDQCEQLPACAGNDEDRCVAASYCDPIYQGVNCVCEGDACTCESWDFQSCEDSATDLMP